MSLPNQPGYRLPALQAVVAAPSPEVNHICAAGPDVGPLPTAPGQGSSSVGSPTARSSGAAAFGRDLPDAPPYKVYMGNVSYDLTDAAVRDLFRDSRVSGTAAW